MNKFMYAMAVGTALSIGATGAQAHSSPDKEKENSILRASHVLPSKDGEEFRNTVREADEENAQLEQQIAQYHSALYALLTAQDFDKNAFLTRAKELRGLQEETKENRDNAFAAAVEQLTPDERIKLAQAMDTQRTMMHKKHHKHGNAAVIKDQNARSGNTPDDKPAQ